MWTGAHLLTLCHEHNGDDCSVLCDKNTGSQISNADTRCLLKAIQSTLPDTEFFMVMDDQVLVDRNHIYS
ncbi:hypothetical protein H4R20_007327, partial [Coemansia guatemalensis]